MSKSRITAKSPKPANENEQKEQGNRKSLQQRHAEIARAARVNYWKILNKDRYTFQKVGDGLTDAERKRSREAGLAVGPEENKYFDYGVYETHPKSRGLLDYYEKIDPRTGQLTGIPVVAPIKGFLESDRSAYSKAIDFLAAQGNTSITPTWKDAHSVRILQLYRIMKVAEGKKPPMPVILSAEVRERLSAGPFGAARLRRWLERAAKTQRKYNEFMQKHGYDPNVGQAKQDVKVAKEISSSNPIPLADGAAKDEWRNEKKASIAKALDGKSTEEQMEIIEKWRDGLLLREDNYKTREEERNQRLQELEEGVKKGDPAAVQALVGEGGKAAQELGEMQARERASLDAEWEALKEKHDGLKDAVDAELEAAKAATPDTTVTVPTEKEIDDAAAVAEAAGREAKEANEEAAKAMVEAEGLEADAALKEEEAEQAAVDVTSANEEVEKANAAAEAANNDWSQAEEEVKKAEAALKEAEAKAGVGEEAGKPEAGVKSEQEQLVELMKENQGAIIQAREELDDHKSKPDPHNPEWVAKGKELESKYQSLIDKKEVLREEKKELERKAANPDLLKAKADLEAARKHAEAKRAAADKANKNADSKHEARDKAVEKAAEAGNTAKDARAKADGARTNAEGQSVDAKEKQDQADGARKKLDDMTKAKESAPKVDGSSPGVEAAQKNKDAYEKVGEGITQAMTDAKDMSKELNEKTLKAINQAHAVRNEENKSHGKRP